MVFISDTNRKIFIAVLTLLAVFLAGVGLGFVLFPIPLLMAYRLFKDKKKAFIPFLISFVAIGAWLWIRKADFLEIVLFVSVWAESFMWFLFYEKKQNMLHKLFYCSIPAVVVPLAAVCLLCFTQFGQNELNSILVQMRDVFSAFTEDGEPVLQVEKMIDVFTYSFVPFVMLAGFLPVIITESAAHKFDAAWQADFAFMSMPSFFAYFYLAMFAVCVFLMKTAALNGVKCIAVNLTGGFSLHYMLSGLSTVTFRLRKRFRFLRVSTLFFITCLLMFIPFAGFVWLVSLLLLGVLGSWIDFRK